MNTIDICSEKEGVSRLFVGFLRPEKTPPIIAKALAISCKNKDIDLLYFTPEGIDYKNKKINGKLFIEDQWIEIKTSVPNFIDIQSNLIQEKQYEKEIKFLAEYSTLSVNQKYLISKDTLQNILTKNNRLNKYMIPSKETNSYKDILNFLEIHKKIVIKNKMDFEQNSKCIVQKQNSIYRVVMKEKELKFSQKEFEVFLHERVGKQTVVLYKFINSITKLNNPYYCCIHLEKDGNNRWKVVHKYIRVGVEKNIFSKIEEGGISKINNFLKVNFPSKNKQILLELNELGLNLAKKIEDSVKGELMVLGLEIGIDSEGELYIFNVKNSPIESPQTEKISLIRPDYYSYRLRNISISRSKKTQELIESLNRIKNENIILTKKIKEYENSTSWKITKPVRILGSFLKK